MDHPSELQFADRPLEVETACVDATFPLIVETRARQLRGFTGDEVNTLKQFMDRMIDNLS